MQNKDAKRNKLIDEYRRVTLCAEELGAELADESLFDMERVRRRRQYAVYCELLTVIYWRLFYEYGVDMHIYRS